jgi:hypothetical protein
MTEGENAEWTRQVEGQPQPALTLCKKMCKVNDGVEYMVVTVKKSHIETEQVNDGQEKKGEKESPLSSGIMLLLVDDVASAIELKDRLEGTEERKSEGVASVSVEPPRLGRKRLELCMANLKDFGRVLGNQIQISKKQKFNPDEFLSQFC